MYSVDRSKLCENKDVQDGIYGLPAKYSHINSTIKYRSKDTKIMPNVGRQVWNIRGELNLDTMILSNSVVFYVSGAKVELSVVSACNSI